MHHPSRVRRRRGGHLAVSQEHFGWIGFTSLCAGGRAMRNKMLSGCMLIVCKQWVRVLWKGADTLTRVVPCRLLIPPIVQYPGGNIRCADPNLDPSLLHRTSKRPVPTWVSDAAQAAGYRSNRQHKQERPRTKQLFHSDGCDLCTCTS